MVDNLEYLQYLKSTGQVYSSDLQQEISTKLQGVNSMSQYFKSVTQQNNLTVFTVQFSDGEALTIDSSQPNFKAVVAKDKEIQEQSQMFSKGGFISDKTLEEMIDELRDLMRVDRAISRVSGGRVELRGGQVYVDGQPATGYLADKIMGLYAEGHGVDVYLKFMERLQQNPDARIRGERGEDGDLMRFIDYGKLPLMPDGRLVAYKVVRSNFFDKYTGTMDNSPGNIVELRENQVDNDPNRTCSRGLHACSKEYAMGFFYNSDDRIVAVAIDPADVRAVPVDYNNTKLRCIRYEVLFELTKDNVDKDILAQRAVIGYQGEGKLVTTDLSDDSFDDVNYDFDEDEQEEEEYEEYYDDGLGYSYEEFYGYRHSW